MDDLAFAFRDHPVRVIMDGTGAPWWVGADVCAALEIANSRHALSALDEDEKGVASADTLGGRQSVATVNEAGLYRLIFTSRKPAAEAFKRWLAHEVLPELRRAGRYSVPSVEAPEDPPPSAEYWLGLVREARLTHGRVAAARIWADSPLPQVAIAAPLRRAVDQVWVEFLQECCQVTGNSGDFLRSSTLSNALARYCDRLSIPWPGDRSAANALRRVSGNYRDPETGRRMSPAKRSNTGYSGVQLRKSDLID